MLSDAAYERLISRRIGTEEVSAVILREIPSDIPVLDETDLDAIEAEAQKAEEDFDNRYISLDEVDRQYKSRHNLE
ncbi:MAG TPA: hypothetical protein O0X70_02940 [Methanocorpusculum sp.]|nr:hypothetical protein [Methanocorpusculum sp.]